MKKFIKVLGAISFILLIASSFCAVWMESVIPFKITITAAIILFLCLLFIEDAV